MKKDQFNNMDVANQNLLDNGFLNIEGGVPPFYSIEGGVPVFYSAEGDSEAEAEGEAETENEDYTEYENEESEIDVPQEDLPRFRVLVRNKKLELKAQYGKAHIENHSITERKCTTTKVPEAYTERECKQVPYPCPTFKEPLKVCYKEVCVNVPKVRMIDKEVCVNVPKIRFVWVSGWRKKWREFKRDGGLAQLKLQSKGLAPITPPSYTPEFVQSPAPIATKPDILTNSSLTCIELANKYGIIAGQSWGSAPKEVIDEWIKRGCTVSPYSNQTDDSTERETEVLDKPKPKTKKSSSNTGLYVGLGLVALVGGLFLIKKYTRKS